MIELLTLVGTVYIIMWCCSTTFKAIWFLLVCRQAKERFCWKRYLFLVIVIPIWILLAHQLIGIVRARGMEHSNKCNNFRYFNVATTFGLKKAQEIYGDRGVIIGGKVIDRLREYFQQLLQK